MHVRPATGPDLPACLDLFEDVCAEKLWLATEPPVDRREVRARWEALLSTREGTLLLAEDAAGAEPCGLAAMVGRARPELGMLVAAGARGRGVGDALLAACVSWAREIGAQEVVLHVFLHNSAAIRLYRKHGFEDRGTLRHAYPRASGERWDALRMVKPLRPGRPS